MKKENVRSLSLIMAVVLMLGSVIGGTVAWLIATPDPVVNTFTYGDINITLTETDTKLDADDNNNTNTYKMVPGQTIKKDPVITAKAGSEDMWLFVKLEKSEGFDNFMTYEMEGTWTALSGVGGVYYKEVSADYVATEDKEFWVLKDHTVVVKDTVTKDMLYELKAYPTLTVTAYAVQRAGIDTAADAWAKISTTP